MKLYLMRHGEAAGTDADPELSANGRAGIETLAKRLEKKNIRFEQILHSEKTRARQTAEIMAAVLSPELTPQQRSGLKPNDDPRKLQAEIDDWQQDTLICSHLPFVPSLLELLTSEPQGMGFVPGTIICLQKNDHAWQIDWIESP
ncbi:MAG: phosphohistidine phosphatase SixA [Gammaproteobacteria bacterium]|nr:phosphohistidine phosphatase SixA [Gammaproteobacteria bacterium]MDH5777188.1 phosphohistidine phosphatase SixA [Gammaproteobacteria bacterium]